MAQVRPQPAGLGRIGGGVQGQVGLTCPDGMWIGYLTFFISVPNLCSERAFVWLLADGAAINPGTQARRKQSGLENITFGDLWISNKRNYSFK